MRTTKKFAFAASLAAVALVMSACSTGSGAGSEPSSGGELSESAQKALDAAYAGVGSDLADLPSVPVTPNIDFYAISCGEQVPGCSVPAAAMNEAAEAAGWKSTIADGKLNPDGFAAAIRQAIAGGAGVISPVGIGCGIAQAAFQEAADAKITVVGGGGVDDCDPKLWASERLWLPGYTPIQQWNEYGKLQADYAFGKTNGAVKAVVLNFTGQVWGQWITDGFTSELTSLGGGAPLATIDVADSEVGDGSFVQKVTTALLAQPDANVLVVPLDSWLTNGLASSLTQAGLDAQLLVIGRGGEAPALDLIRQGDSGLDATIGYAGTWGSWGSVDTALRVLAQEEPQYIGEPMQAVDADHNLPASGSYQGTVDYKAKFLAAWGLG